MMLDIFSSSILFSLSISVYRSKDKLLNEFWQILTFHQSFLLSVSESVQVSNAAEWSFLVILADGGLYVSQFLLMQVFFALSPSLFKEF